MNLRNLENHPVAWWLTCILVTAALLRAWYLLEVTQAPDFAELRQDMSVQDYHARAILSGDWTLPEGRSDPKIATTPYYRPPAYTYLLSALYFVSGGSYLAPRVFNIILGLVSILFMFRLARIIFGPVAGLITAGLMAVYWGFIYYEGEVNDPAVFVFLLPCLLLSLHQWQQTCAVRWVALAGLITGCFALMRPNILLYGPVMAAWVLYTGWRAGKLKQTALAWGALAGVTALTIAPITVRNYVVSGEFVPISTYFGENLYIGNSEDADGYTSWTPYLQELEGSGQFSVWEYDRIVQGLGREVGNENLTHSEASTIFMHKALEWMRENKRRTVELTIKKALLFWSPWEITENKVVHYEKAYYPPLKFLPGFPHVLALFLFGTVLLIYDSVKKGFEQIKQETGAVSPREMLLLVYGLVIIYWGSFFLFFVNARARHPMAGFLLMIGAYGLLRLVRVLRQGRYAVAAGLLLLLTIFYGVARIDVFQYQPDLARWHYARADSWLRAGEIENAREEAETLLAKDFSLYMPFRLGHSFALKGEYDIAARLLRAALGERPEEQPQPYVQDLYFHIGVVLAADGHSEEARAAFDEALRLNPRDSRAHNDLAVLLEEEGELDLALAHYRAAVEANPEFLLALTNLGDLLGRMGDFEGAVDAFRSVLETAPENPEYQYNYAVQLTSLGRPEEAMDVYSALLSRYPDDIRALNNQAWLLAGEGRTEEAKALYRRALAVAPDYTLARANLGNLLIEQGDWEGGITVYKEGLEHNPEDADLLNGIGYQYALHGDPARARGFYEEALRLQPDFTKARINLAYACVQAGDLNAALEHFSILDRQHPGNPDFLLELGNIHARRNRLEEAARFYSEALEADPDSEAARTNLGLIQSLKP